jgi:hypothetical protein
MVKDVDYIIKKDSLLDFSVVKFINGDFSQEYRITKYPTGMECSCMSGIYRGYCKHKDWVRLAEKGKELPSNVSLALEPNRKKMKEFINSILKDENK